MRLQIPRSCPSLIPGLSLWRLSLVGSYSVWEPQLSAISLTVIAAAVIKGALPLSE